MGKPVVPNLVPVAQQQGELNKQTATDIAQANRYTQTGPEGSTNVWGVDPNTGVATNTTTMGARPQAYYNALMDTGTAAASQFGQKYYGTGAGGGAPGGNVSPLPAGANYGYLEGQMPNNYAPANSRIDEAQNGKVGGVGGIGKGIQGDLDYSKLTAMPGDDIGAARQQAQDALYNRSAGYLDPQWQESQRSTEAQLANQGLTPGTPAYDRAYANLQSAKEKAYTGARQDAIAGGGAEAARAQEMALQLRNQGVTEAGNLGAFHNAAQGQRAGQLLTDLGQKRSLEGQLGSAGIMANVSMHNANLANQLGLRQQEYTEATGFGKPAQEFLPQFGISQGNVGQYKAPDIYGATQTQYEDALARYQAKKPNSFLQQVALAGVGAAGNAARAYVGAPSAGTSGGAAP